MHQNVENNSLLSTFLFSNCSIIYTFIKWGLSLYLHPLTMTNWSLSFLSHLFPGATKITNDPSQQQKIGKGQWGSGRFVEIAVIEKAHGARWTEVGSQYSNPHKTEKKFRKLSQQSPGKPQVQISRDWNWSGHAGSRGCLWDTGNPASALPHSEWKQSSWFSHLCQSHSW